MPNAPWNGKPKRFPFCFALPCPSNDRCSSRKTKIRGRLPHLLPIPASIRRPVLPQIPLLPAHPPHHHVDVGIVDLVAGRAVADFEQECYAGVAVDDVVAVSGAGGEAGRPAGGEPLLAAVGHPHHLARQHTDKLVRPAVPARRGPRA